MAMGVEGGGGGVPEQEDSVLFRRGAGQVRPRPALPLDERPLPGPHGPSLAAGRDLATQFTAGLRSVCFYIFLHLGASSASSFLAQLGYPDSLEPRS